MFFCILFSGKFIMSDRCWDPSVVPEKGWGIGHRECPGQAVSTILAEHHHPWAYWAMAPGYRRLRLSLPSIQLCLAQQHQAFCTYTVSLSQALATSSLCSLHSKPPRLFFPTLTWAWLTHGAGKMTKGLRDPVGQHPLSHTPHPRGQGQGPHQRSHNLLLVWEYLHGVGHGWGDGVHWEVGAERTLKEKSLEGSWGITGGEVTGGGITGREHG